MSSPALHTKLVLLTSIYLMMIKVAGHLEKVDPILKEYLAGHGQSVTYSKITQILKHC